MKNKKKYIVLIILIIIYIVVMIIIFGKNNQKKQETSYLMIGNDIKWKLKDKKWTDVIESDNILTNMTKFHVYVNNEYFGDYNLTFNEKWYLFDDNRKSVSYDNDILAFTENLDIKVENFKFEEFNDQDNEIINKILTDNNINTNETLTNTQKLSLDFDNDGKIETLYMINNLFEPKEKAFGLVFILDNNKIKILHKKVIDAKDMYKICMPYISNIVDINQDKNYEIILGCSYFSNQGNCSSMFQAKKNKYEKIKSCN